jgi:hypothetical protein
VVSIATGLLISAVSLIVLAGGGALYYKSEHS